MNKRRLASESAPRAAPTRQAGAAALALDQQLCFAIYSAMSGVTRVYRPLLKGLGLTYPQYLVMLVLWQEEGLTVSAIGEKLFLDSATLTPLLKRLEMAGLVARLRASHDERQVLVSLTARGRALKDRARSIPGCLLSATQTSLADVRSLRARLVSLRESLMQSAA